MCSSWMTACQAQPKQPKRRKQPLHLGYIILLAFFFPRSKRMGSLAMGQTKKKTKKNTNKLPGSSVRDPFGGFKWPFQVLLVTSIWVIKRSLGRSCCLIKKKLHNYLQQIITEHNLCCPILPKTAWRLFFSTTKNSAERRQSDHEDRGIGVFSPVAHGLSCWFSNFHASDPPKNSQLSRRKWP